VLLTVQVVSPDGADQLVQFRSLKQILAVKKTLGSALSLFKQRVYRGAEVVVEDSEREQAEEKAEADAFSAGGIGVVEDFSASLGGGRRRRGLPATPSPSASSPPCPSPRTTALPPPRPTPRIPWSTSCSSCTASARPSRVSSCSGSCSCPAS
jgi:hypothetical protein